MYVCILMCIYTYIYYRCKAWKTWKHRQEEKEKTKRWYYKWTV